MTNEMKYVMKGTVQLAGKRRRREATEAARRLAEIMA